MEESDLAYFLHIAFQNNNIEPGILMGLRTRNDKIPAGERAFILASVKKAIMDGDTPVRIKNFAKKEERQ